MKWIEWRVCSAIRSHSEALLLGYLCQSLRILRIALILRTDRQSYPSNLAAMTNLAYPAYIPQDEDAQLSRESSRILAPHINSAARHIKIIEPDGTEQSALIPAAAYRLLVDVLTQMAQGNAVTLIPIHAELTTQEAADLLNVSRPYLIKQIEAGAIPYHKIGRHRRIRFEDLMAYKQQADATRSQALDELVAASQALGLYD
jgi:excisionase family DNA binding protein